MRVLSALLLVVLVASGCGVMFRADVPPAPLVPDSAAASLDPVTPRPNPVLPPVNLEPLFMTPGQTILTLTFDDGRESNALAGKMMADRGLRGTFFINSGHVGLPTFLGLDQVDELAKEGHEIGGHTVTHPDFDLLNPEEIARQICQDRSTLMSWGFPVRNFAYPFAIETPDTLAAVKMCGYNSARSLGMARTVHLPSNAVAGADCAGCDWSENLPPNNIFYTAAPAQVKNDWTMQDFIDQIQHGEDTSAGWITGGWIQLTFHGLCPDDCTDVGIKQELFGQLLDWIVEQRKQGKFDVRTVGDMMAGPVQPAVDGPSPTTELVNPDLEATHDGVPDCWMRASFGKNHPEFSTIPDAHSGSVAEKLVMTDYQDGDAKLIPTEDLGSCTLAVQSGSVYTIGAWYHSTAPTRFSVQYRTARGNWFYGTASPKFDAANGWTHVTFTLPKIPDKVTGISFGMTLSSNGELVTDDYSFNPGTQGPS